MKRWICVCFAMLTMLLVVASPAAAAPGGNSADAAACQDGGYRNYTRANQTPFKNAGQCTAYAAEGNALAYAVLTFVDSSTPGFCLPALTVSGYNPGTYTMNFSPNKGVGVVIVVDAERNGSAVGLEYYNTIAPGTTITAFVGGMFATTGIAADCG